jgi:serine protease
MPVKVLNSSGSGYNSVIAEGITYAADQGAEVINMSLGGSDPTGTLAAAVEYAYGKGSTLVAASGNSGTETLMHPAAHEKVIAVGSLRDATNLSAFSNYGSGLSLVAPGENIYSTRLGGGYTSSSGTSMSAPFVAGLAAMLSGIDASLSPAQIQDIMEQTAVDLGDPGLDIRTTATVVSARLQRFRPCSAPPRPRPSLRPSRSPRPRRNPSLRPRPRRSPSLPAPEPEPSPEPEATPQPAPTDVTPPTVRITSPWEGNVVSGNIY